MPVRRPAAGVSQPVPAPSPMLFFRRPFAEGLFRRPVLWVRCRFFVPGGTVRTSSFSSLSPLRSDPSPLCPVPVPSPFRPRSCPVPVPVPVPALSRPVPAPSLSLSLSRSCPVPVPFLSRSCPVPVPSLSLSRPCPCLRPLVCRGVALPLFFRSEGWKTGKIV